MRAAQALGYAIVVLAWAGYARGGMWSDFANASLWLGVVLALAFDVRSPPDAARLRAHRSRRAARGVLYAGLVALALWWAASGEPLNGFDAALWLLCFVATEGNILRHENAEAAPRTGDRKWPWPRPRSGRARDRFPSALRCGDASGRRAPGRRAPGRWIQAAIDTPSLWIRRATAMNRDAFEDALQEAAQAAVEALARAGLSLAGDAGTDLLDAIHEALEDVLREHGLEPDEGGDEED